MTGDERVNERLITAKLQKMFEAYQEMKAVPGWQDPCPWADKDFELLVIEPGSTGLHEARCDGFGYFIGPDGDHSDPVLVKRVKRIEVDPAELDVSVPVWTDEGIHRSYENVGDTAALKTKCDAHSDVSVASGYCTEHCKWFLGRNAKDRRVQCSLYSVPTEKLVELIDNRASKGSKIERNANASSYEFFTASVPRNPSGNHAIAMPEGVERKEYRNVWGPEGYPDGVLIPTAKDIFPPIDESKPVDYSNDPEKNGRVRDIRYPPIQFGADGSEEHF